MDSDALQRLCTGNSLSVVGAGYDWFDELSGLVEAMRAGQQFDAVVLGLHANGMKALPLLLDVAAEADCPLPVLYVVHDSEMALAHRLPSRMRAPPSFQMLASPVDDGALLAWLNGLDLWDRRVEGAGRRKASGG
ncbi:MULTISPECIES: hypothetical protein [unclassified Variovorax]|uniref:hypothetical protein n=1 Tax=unclassified Variovorax TaxID=663243 RepID=UPI000F7EB452|nr:MULTISPECIES: hypothetical protein [unclassified Variovorax]RSZ42292.1 hypothetical protein EJO70_10675 [Variovorax sp. 553]RSZ43267.1 hypothetical protein EJO71_10665 [Variovorax sp. 679]